MTKRTKATTPDPKPEAKVEEDIQNTAKSPDHKSRAFANSLPSTKVLILSTFVHFPRPIVQDGACDRPMEVMNSLVTLTLQSVARFARRLV